MLAHRRAGRPAITSALAYGQLAYIDAAHRIHARVEDCIHTGKDTGIGKFPARDLALNSAWLTASLTAATLLAWLRLLALDGDLAKAEPATLRYRILHATARLTRSSRRRQLKIPPPAEDPAAWPGPMPSPPPGSGSPHCRKPLTSGMTSLRPTEGNPGDRGTPGHRPASRPAVIPPP
jgi:Transposase DDE domain group 1